MGSLISFSEWRRNRRAVGVLGEPHPARQKMQHIPSQSFTRSGAVMMIGPIDPVTKKPDFADYESLYIEARDHRGPLKPQDAFNYLLKKGVFRAGLKLLCPNCELDSW